ncbi:hypothetical protein K4K48_008752 [Colletotrichum sp. SAR 10_66]|nr:hypothetical protein K4K48_008752 [Colletotrichum sp. SAR 10_66]
MARAHPSKVADKAILQKTCTGTALLKQLDAANKNRGKILDHNELSSPKELEVRQLQQGLDHMVYMFVRDDEVVSIWPVMEEILFEGEILKRVKTLTISANPDYDRPTRPATDGPGSVSPVTVKPITGLSLSPNLVKTLKEPSGIGHVLIQSYRKKKWTMSHEQHCQNVCEIINTIRSLDNNDPAREDMIQVLNDYVVGMSSKRTEMRRKSGFVQRNFGDILQSSIEELEKTYANSTTRSPQGIDSIPFVRGGSGNDSDQSLSLEDRKITNPEHHELLKELTLLDSQSTWDKSSLNPKNSVYSPNSKGEATVVYDEQGRRDFHGICRALFGNINASIDTLHGHFSRPREEGSEDKLAEDMFKSSILCWKQSSRRNQRYTIWDSPKAFSLPTAHSIRFAKATWRSYSTQAFSAWQTRCFG